MDGDYQASEQKRKDHARDGVTKFHSSSVCPLLRLGGSARNSLSIVKRGDHTIPRMPFKTSEEGYRARCRLAGLNRAAYWRELGFPNLKRATAARMEKRRQRKMLAELKPLQQTSLTVQPPSGRWRGRL